MKNPLLNTLALTAAVACLALAACTDTQMAKLTAYGEAGHITCYSGGTVVLDAWSTGRIQKEQSGADGFAFMDDATGLLTESNGDCVVVHGAKR